MSDIDDLLIFRGDSDGEAEDFIRAVNVQAFTKGKSRDQEWLSTFASAAFAGKALRWYLRLPLTTREDWNALQEAMIGNDWDKSKSHSASSIIVPAPPPVAAPPATTSARGGVSSAPNNTLPSSLPVSDPTMFGRIRVIQEDSRTPGYLKLNSDKTQLTFSTSLAEAVVVEWDSSLFPCKLKFVGQDSPYAYPLLGLQFKHDNIKFVNLGPGNLECLYLTPVTNSRSGTRKAMTGTNAMERPARGRVMATVWSILQDGSLVATLEQDRVIIQPELVISNNNYLWFATDAEATVREWPYREGKIARLYLEML